MTKTVQAGASTAPAARPTDPERRAVLAAAVAEQLGEWTTRRVQRLYVATFGPGPWRRAARGDLAELHRASHLHLHDEVPGRRFYTANPIGDR